MARDIPLKKMCHPILSASNTWVFQHFGPFLSFQFQNDMGFESIFSVKNINILMGASNEKMFVGSNNLWNEVNFRQETI